MARPKRCRMVSMLPRVTKFIPESKNYQINQEIIMTVEEYETIRLIDYEKMTQEKCAQMMQVARTTVQQIYNTARKKIATSLIDGYPLIVSGGHYQLTPTRPCPRCQRHRGFK